MFAAEWLKMRSLPAPRLTLIITIALTVVVGVIVVAIGPQGSDAKFYYEGPASAAEIAVAVGAIILGAWMFGLEFASNTLRLAATAQPSRWRLIGVKLVSALALITAFAAIGLAFSVALGALLSSFAGIGYPFRSELNGALSLAAQAVLWGAFAFGLALLLRSYTAGLVAAFVIALLVDPALQAIPTVGKYSFGSAVSALGSSITGDSSSLSLATALLTAVVWLVVVIGAGAVRFTSRDLK